MCIHVCRSESLWELILSLHHVNPGMGVELVNRFGNRHLYLLSPLASPMMLYFKYQLFLYNERKWVKTRIAKEWRVPPNKQAKPEESQILKTNHNKATLEVEVHVGMLRAALALPFLPLLCFLHPAQGWNAPAPFLSMSSPSPHMGLKFPQGTVKAGFCPHGHCGNLPNLIFFFSVCIMSWSTILLYRAPNMTEQPQRGSHQTSLQVHSDVQNHPWAILVPLGSCHLHPGLERSSSSFINQC